MKLKNILLLDIEIDFNYYETLKKVFDVIKIIGITNMLKEEKEEFIKYNKENYNVILINKL